MELTQSALAFLTGACPGNCALYRVQEGRLATLYAAPGLPALSGMSEAEYRALTETDAAAVVLESDRAMVAQNVRALVCGSAAQAEVAYRILHRTKDFIWVRAAARIIGTQDGCPVLMTVFHDSGFGGDEHAFLLDHALAAIYVMDRTTHELLYVNGPGLAQFGHGSCCGRRCYDYVAGRSDPCPWCSLPDLTADGCAGRGEFFFEPTGTWMSVRARAMTWFGRAAMAVYGLDITEHKTRQQNLQIDRDMLEKIVTNLPVGIGVCTVTDGKAAAVAVNPRICELMGAGSAHFAADRNTLQRVHPDDREAVLQMMRRCALPGTVCEQEYRFLPAGAQEYLWYRLEARTIPQQGGAMAFVCVTDITARKRAAQELLKSRRMYQTAASAARLVLWEYDPAAHVIRMMTDNDCTRTVCAEMDIPAVMADGPAALTPRIPEKDRPAFLAMHRALDEGAACGFCDFGFRMPATGEVRYVHVICTAIPGEDGSTLTVYGIGQDTTARHEAEEKYDLAYEQLAQTYPLSLGSFRLNLTKNWCGDGRSPLPFVLEQQRSGTADGYFAAFAQLIADEDVRRRFDAQFTRPALLEAFRAGRTRLSIEYPIVYPDGRRYWREGLLFLLQNPRTGDVEAVTCAVDIDARKKNEQIVERLTHAEFDYTALLHPATGRFEFCDRQEGISFGAVGEQLDYDAFRRYVGARCVVPAEREAFLRRTRLAAVLARLRAHGRCACSYTCVKNGVTTRRHLQYSWLEKPEGDVLLLRSDITAAYEQEQKRLRQMQAALRAAEDANRAKTEFLSRISHDIRTPISIISSMAAFALEDVHDEARLRDDLAKIQSADTLLLSLISDVLDISKIDSGKIELNPEPYPFDEYIANIRNVLEPLCIQKGLHFAVERRRRTGVIVADKIRLNQIALNLLSNAVKYTPPGGSVTYVSDSCDQPDGTIRHVIEVRDTGIGMSEAFQKRMFEPFTQEYDNPGRSKAASGTGLGLSIVRRIVDLMGGTLTVKSELGKGTVIRCTNVFPDALRDARWTGALQREQAPAAPAARTLTGRVLLAEDNAVNTQIAVRLLTGFGLTVDCAENGDAAVQRFEAGAPGTYAAVLMDLQMPLVNGYEAAQRIRAAARPDAKTVPILAMTADAFSEALQRCREAGMNGCILKPLDPQRLLEVLARCLAGDAAPAGKF